ncbi:MAG TPA: hypothetical protein VLQ80_15190 [Candidatus Saccharimonadia bacterium]|nr:hypothetical protein [Candidatus Saccharimonadia bacterium]
MDKQDFHAALAALLDQVRWIPMPRADDAELGRPYATHEGLLDLPGLGRVPVYQLNTGERVFDSEILEQLVGLDVPGEDER